MRWCRSGFVGRGRNAHFGTPVAASSRMAGGVPQWAVAMMTSVIFCASSGEMAKMNTRA